MTLYSWKESNIRKTLLLFTLFLVFVIGVGWFFSWFYNSSAILYIAVIFSILMNIFAYWYSDKIVLRLAKAIPIKKENASELYNIVENLSITVGIPMPKIYLVDDDQPNAFATGRDPKHAVIVVTEGLLKKLDRSELEGVISHELSHIINRDILLSTIIVVLVGFISILSDLFFRSILWGGLRKRDNEESGTIQIIFILIALVLAILAPIVAGIIQLAISRKREFLADATGALITRYPEGLARALEKISQYPYSLKRANNTTAHLWFSDPFRKNKKTFWLHRLFMTHPPIDERIRKLREMSKGIH